MTGSEIPASAGEDLSSLGAAALWVLTTSDAQEKASNSRTAARLWQSGALGEAIENCPPDRPARPAAPQLLSPGQMPRRRKGGSVQTRIALLHAVAHIELNAIDLAWDLVARFGAEMPRDFLDDWVQVADDEARHFMMIADRLTDLGACYGDLPAHDGLWEASQATAKDLGARLAVVPMVLEARGLDVTPSMINRLKAMGDSQSADALSVIYADEVGHVAAGQKWFHWLCARDGKEPQLHFQTQVTNYFRGALKPPFNTEARSKAGLPRDFYEPLAQKCP
ncbi:rhamnosyltransferase [Iodidimonas muriae]|uniref:Rhamnosyltransferase n=1 Tax=Iodidimonas muriae TaxID=261467 RepID=A0ABQ2LEL4_9PROT|nr:ferritin-like domain-containing protein [Iodidimonas muriae]GER07020.1 rhamnosyltransferase [Kordiimonadales bacterium JCM 17843]GGO13330.1 rhamnosyltransferase [Iodidimonas muriae]